MRNCYNFSRPITDKACLAGRRAELVALRNYLQPGPPESLTNVMIVGDRGIGKTSLLNVAYQYCLDQGHATIRCDLDDEMVSEKGVFFLEVIDELMALIRSEAPRGVDIQKRIGLNSAQSVCSTHAAGRSGVMTQATLRRTIQELQAELGIPRRRRLLVLIDEGDSLLHNTALLQRIRNTLALSIGVQLIIANTGALLHYEGRTFPPFNRSFATIHLKPFRSLEETRECIRLPIKINGSDRDIPRQFVEQVHHITGGHPYLIQLVCHTWFNRQMMANGKKVSFALESDTLNDLWELACDLSYPSLGEFWKNVRDIKGLFCVTA